MLPHEVFRAAAALIREGGHSKGFHAHDAAGNGVAVFGNTRAGHEVDTSRAEPNPNAVAYSLYGALATVLYRESANASAVWPLVADEAQRALDSDFPLVTGGTNSLHPLMALNDHPRFEQDYACAFLERCALLVEPVRDACVETGVLPATRAD